MRTYLLMVLLAVSSPAVSQLTLDSTILDTHTVAGGLDIPWEMQWGPDDHIWFTERYGRISRLDPDSETVTVLLDHSNVVYQDKESGMLGLVLHPDFENQPYLYVAYTWLSGGTTILERLSRFEYDGTGLINETILMDSIPGNPTHDGARLLILPDTTLLMTTGDAQDQSLPQNINSLAGKVLRMNLDGSIPTDNPIAGNYAWSWGHRNAQGLCRTPEGVIWSSEHGPTTDDEFNIIAKGGNYGWPNVHGYCDSPTETVFCNDSNVIEPILAWTPTVAASDLIWYDHPAIPEWQNSFLMTSLKNQRLYQIRVTPNALQFESEDQWFNQVWERLRDIVAAPDGRVFLATSGTTWTNTAPFTHRIIELTNGDYVSTEELVDFSDAVSIFPNPTKESIVVDLPEGQGWNLEWTTVAGQLIGSDLLNGGRNELSTTQLKPGIYLARFSSGKKFAVRKVVITP